MFRARLFPFHFYVSVPFCNCGRTTQAAYCRGIIALGWLKVLCLMLYNKGWLEKFQWNRVQSEYAHLWK